MLSIDIGSKNIAAVEGSYSPRSGLSVVKAASARLDTGMVGDNLIKNAEGVSDILLHLIKDNRFRSKKASVTINGASALTREFDLPAAKPSQLRAMVRNEMINTYAAGSTDAIEFKRLHEAVSDDGVKRLHLRAMAISEFTVRSYYELLSSASLRPFAMDAHSNAIEKLLQPGAEVNGLPIDGKSFIMLDIGFSGIVCNILHGSETYVSRFIPLGMNDLASMLSNQLLLTAEQAAGNFTGALDLADPEKADNVSTGVARGFFSQCANEIQRVIMYISARLPVSDITRVFIYGGGSEIGGVDACLSAELGIPVSRITSLSGVHVKESCTENVFSRYINALGALIRLK